MKKVCAFVVLCSVAACSAHGESIAVAIEMKSPARMQLALADVCARGETIDGTSYLNQLADSWYADTAWWKHAIAHGVGLISVSRAITNCVALNVINMQNAADRVRGRKPLLGKTWFASYTGSAVGSLLVATGTVVGWSTLHHESTRMHVSLARMLTNASTVTIDRKKLTTRAQFLLKRVGKK